MIRNILIYVSIFAIFVYAYIAHIKYVGENAISANAGYRFPTDSVETLVARIKWANGYTRRVSYTLRYLIYACIISWLVCIVVENVKPWVLIQLVLVIWLALMSFHRYFYHHADKYPHYYIHDNVCQIQKLLGLKDIDNLPIRTNTEPLYTECHNYA